MSTFENHANPVLILFGNHAQTNVALIRLKELFDNTKNMRIFTHEMSTFLVDHFDYPKSYPALITDISDIQRDKNWAFERLPDAQNERESPVERALSKLEEALHYELFFLYSSVKRVSNVHLSFLYKKPPQSNYEIYTESKRQLIPMMQVKTPGPPTVHMFERNFPGPPFEETDGFSPEDHPDFDGFHPEEGEFFPGEHSNYDIHAESKCVVVICGPGRYKVYGEIPGGYG